MDDPFEDDGPDAAAAGDDARPAASDEAPEPGSGKLDDALDAFEEAAFEALEGAGDLGSEPGSGAAPEGESGADAPSVKGRRRRSAKKGAARRRVAVRVVLGVLAVALAAAAVASSLFSWNRWFRFDDAADLQGQWAIADGQGSISIDGESIHLTDFEAYGYTVDADSKTLTFTFSDLSGSARYRFSADRTQLAIQDGTFSFSDTLADDIAWAWGRFVSSLTGSEGAGPSFGEGSLVLTRIGPAESAGQSGEEPSEDASYQLNPEGSSDGAASDASEGEAPATGADDAAGSGGSAPEDGSASPGEGSDEGESAGEQAAEEALSLSGSGSVGGNAVKPEDLL